MITTRTGGRRWTGRTLPTAPTTAPRTAHGTARGTAHGTTLFRALCRLGLPGVVMGLLAAVLPALAPGQGLSPGGPVDFGNSPVGSNAGKISLNFNAAVSTTISAINVVTEGNANLDFSLVTQTCVGTQAPPASCLITLQFTPSAPGLRKGWLSVIDGTGSVVNNVPLRGVGIGPQMVLEAPLSATATTGFASLQPSGFLPTSAVFDGSGNLFFNDIVNSRILEQSANGAVSPVATVSGSQRSSIAINGFGTLFVSSPAAKTVYSLLPGGMAKVVATPGVTLASPTGLAVDGSGYLYIADSATNRIVRVEQDGSSATALTPVGLALPLLQPAGLAVDANHNLYIADAGNNRIVLFSLLTGKASAMAVSGLTLSNPTAVAVSPSGALTVADTGNARFVHIAPDGTATVLVLPGVAATQPAGVALSSNGQLVLADGNAGLIQISRLSASYTFPTATDLGNLDAVDGNLNVLVVNEGNATLQLNLPASGTNPSQTGVAYNLANTGSTCPVIAAGSGPSGANQLAAGASCSYLVSFTPVNTGQNPSTVTIGGGGSGNGTTLTVALNGTGVSKLLRFIVVATPSTTSAGMPVTLTVTAIDTSGQVYTGYLGRILFSATDPAASFLFGGAYTFTTADAGTHTFAAPVSGVDFNTIGTWTVSVADNIYAGTSNPVQVIAQAVVPGASLTASPNPVLLGGTVTMTLQLSAATSGGALPTGTVQFLDGTVALGTASLTNGVATLQTTFITSGNHALSAVYAGGGSYAGTTATTSETVVDYTLTLAPTAAGSATVLGGSGTTYSLVFTPVGASTLPSAVSFALNGLPAGATYTLSPNALATGAGTTALTLTVTTVPNAVAALHLPGSENGPLHGGSRPSRGTGALVSLAALLALVPVAARRRRPHRLLGVALALGALCSSCALTGCLSTASSGYYDSVPQQHTLVVSANAGTLTRSVALSLTVE